MACGSGQLLSDLLSGRTPAIPYEDLSVARYSRGLRHHAGPFYMAHTAKKRDDPSDTGQPRSAGIKTESVIVRRAAPYARLVGGKANAYGHGIEAYLERAQGHRWLHCLIWKRQ